MGDCGGYEYAELSWSGVSGEPGRKPSDGCLGDEVGRLKASCVDEIAVRLDCRVFFVGEKRLANQLIAQGGVEHRKSGSYQRADTKIESECCGRT